MRSERLPPETTTADGPVPREDVGLPEPLADLGRRLTREAHQLEKRNAARKASPQPRSKTNLVSAVQAAVRRDRTRRGPRHPQSSWAVVAAMVAIVLIVVGLQPGVISDPVARGPASERGAGGDVLGEIAVVEADAAGLVSETRPYARSREAEATEAATTPPLFLRRVSGPELEALIDLMDADPSASSSISI